MVSKYVSYSDIKGRPSAKKDFFLLPFPIVPFEFFFLFFLRGRYTLKGGKLWLNLKEQDVCRSKSLL